MNTHRLAAVPFGVPALDALRASVHAAKAGDPLAPVTVVPPSPAAGLSLRRALAAERGLVNVAFTPLHRVAELLGAPALARAGRRPLTPAVRGAAVRRVLAAGPSLLAEVAEHPATERALATTFADLDRARPVTDRGPRRDDLGPLAPLYRDYREVVASFYDATDLALAAARAVAGGGAGVDDIGAVVLHLPDRLDPAEAGLVEALAAAERVWAVVGLTGDTEADAPARALLERLERWLGPPVPGSTAAASPPSPTRVVVAPDPSEEVRQVVREAARRLDRGLPLHGMAVIHAGAQPYPTLLHDAFTAAAIPYNAAPRRPLASTVAGRALRGLLALAGSEFTRRDVLSWLHTAPVLEVPGGALAPVTEWDRVSREAGVVRGLGQWRARLEGHSRRLSAGVEEAGDPDAAAALDAERDVTRRLLRFVEVLAEDLRAAPRGSWGAMGRWGVALLVRYLGTDTERAGWPAHDDDAFRRIEEGLRALSVLDDVDPNPDLNAFRRAVDDLLAEGAARVGAFGDGVFVGRLDQVVGASYDTVHVVGMVEGAFPARPADDPLLPDRQRAEVGVPTRRVPVAAERRAFFAALAAAPERVLSTARCDPRSQQERLPAPWFVESASALLGRPVSAVDVDTWPTAGPAVRVPSFEAGLALAPAPGSLLERDLRELLAAHRSGVRLDAHPLADDALRRALAVVEARRSGRPSSWNGFVGKDAPAVTDDEPRSPTSLEAWAACPFRYFAGHVLKVRERDEPEDVEDLGAAERGSLVHEVLERLVRERGGELAPGQPWSGEARRHAHHLLDELADEYEHRGRTGRPLLWRHQRSRLHTQLERTLDADDELRGRLASVPVAAEMRFGLEEEPPVEVPVGPGRVVRLRGVVDRVDRADDRLVVLDYKTGSHRDFTALDRDWVDAGQRLQLGAYTLAARARHGDLPVDAHYWFISDRGGYRLLPRNGSVTAERLEAFRETVGLVADGIEAGRFPARPGDDTWDPSRRRETFVNCRFCPYDRVCPADRDEAWEALSSHPEVALHPALRTREDRA